MTNIKYYDGFLNITPALSNEEVSFLNNWQKTLGSFFDLIDSTNDLSEKEKNNNLIKEFIGLEFNPKQLWLLKFYYNPLLEFTNDKVIISGETTKGQLRQAISIYHHFFFNDDSFMKRYFNNLDFIKNHSLNGLIEGEIDNKKWVYIVENNNFSSVSCNGIDDYLKRVKNEQFLFKEEKDDDSSKNIDKYFSPKDNLVLYLDLNKTMPKNEIKNKTKKI